MVFAECTIDDTELSLLICNIQYQTSKLVRKSVNYVVSCLCAFLSRLVWQLGGFAFTLCGIFAGK